MLLSPLTVSHLFITRPVLVPKSHKTSTDLHAVLLRQVLPPSTTHNPEVPPGKSAPHSVALRLIVATAQIIVSTFLAITVVRRVWYFFIVRTVVIRHRNLSRLGITRVSLLFVLLLGNVQSNIATRLASSELLHHTKQRLTIRLVYAELVPQETGAGRGLHRLSCQQLYIVAAQASLAVYQGSQEVTICTREDSTYFFTRRSA